MGGKEDKVRQSECNNRSTITDNDSKEEGKKETEVETETLRQTCKQRQTEVETEKEKLTLRELSMNR